jgi:hypothetical protein
MNRAHSRSRLKNPAATPVAVFNPAQLFSMGEQGAWFDPSDMSTLFQDDAGTIPVTATGQPVGMMRDKSGQGNHAIQAVAASRPTFTDSGGLQFLAFDGINDFLQVTSFSLAANDKMSFFAGIRKLNDAARGMVCEMSANVGLNNGTFFLDAPTGAANNISFAAKGTASAVPVVSGLVAPISLVISADADIPGDSVRVRTNAGAYSTTATNLGNGNFGTFPLYIGERGGTTVPFVGNMYGMIIRGVITDSATIISTEQYMATKSGVTL